MKLDYQNALLLVLCLVLLLSVFSLSASAADVPVLLPYSTTNSESVEIVYGTNNSIRARATTNGDVYVFCYRDGSYLYFAFCSQSQNQTISLDAWSLSDSTLSGYSSHSLSNYDGSVGLYFNPVPYTYSSSYHIQVPQYQNITAGFHAVLDLINNPPSPPSSSASSFSYSLPPGNVAYIEMGSSSAIKLSMDFPELSNSFGTPFSKANSAYALVDSLPVVGSSVASGTVIPWAKSGRLNLIGQTSEASFGPIGPIATRYVAVINPSYYDHVTVTGTYRQNPPIQIEALNVLSIHVYPLQSDFTFNNDTGQVSTTIAGDAYTGDVDAETGDIYWTDPNGGSSAPALGGNNLPEAGNSIFDTLRNIASDFSEFLKGPVSAIRVVVSSIREFMGSFTQLYTWLPSPVYNLITSALMIALTIGVIKIFV